MKEYRFYGWQEADVPAAAEKYKKIRRSETALRICFLRIWCADTCAPRMRQNWSMENRTLGQCSITAFLAQDIFGGEVYGVSRGDGNFHCYNVIGDCVFDLTSEQFGERKAILCKQSCSAQRSSFRKRRKEAPI